MFLHHFYFLIIRYFFEKKAYKYIRVVILTEQECLDSLDTLFLCCFVTEQTAAATHLWTHLSVFRLGFVSAFPVSLTRSLSCAI